jgi:hypothetical protein
MMNCSAFRSTIPISITRAANAIGTRGALGHPSLRWAGGFRFADPCEEDMYLMMWRQTRVRIGADLRALEGIAAKFE